MTERSCADISERDGFCGCGCGGKTRVANKTKASRGEFKGQPQRFIHGHASRVVRGTVEQRFWAKVDRAGPMSCWSWTGAGAPSYGAFRYEGRQQPAHRVAYMMLVGPIPDGLQIDHLCRNPNCVNPGHLEPVTPKQNVQRGLGGVLTTHCPQGHAYDQRNTYLTPSGTRQCRACKSEANRRMYARRKGATVPLRPRGRPRVASRP